MSNEDEKTEQKHPGDRPTCYHDKYTEQAYKLTLLGAKDKDLADFFGVCEATINNWKHEFPEFLESLKRGKLQADAEVAESLYHRAKGYSHPEVKVFCQEGKVIEHKVTKHYPPDTGAAIIWLKNRQGLYWRDNHDVNLAGQISFGPVIVQMAGGNGDSTSEPNISPDQVKNVQADEATN